MQKVNFRLTSVAQKRCCLSFLLWGKRKFQTTYHQKINNTTREPCSLETSVWIIKLFSLTDHSFQLSSLLSIFVSNGPDYQQKLTGLMQELSCVNIQLPSSIALHGRQILIEQRKFQVIGIQNKTIDYFPIPHNTLCLPPKFCITYCLKMLLGKYNTPRSI